jgi:hypothetical protein
VLTAVPRCDGMPAVPEYDAFGREIGENTLAGLGADSNPQPETAAAQPSRETPVARATAPEAPRMTSSVPEGAPATALPGVGKRRGAGLGCVVALVVAAAVIAGPVIGVIAIFGEAKDAIDDVTDAFDPGTIDLPDGPAVPGEGPPPTGIAGDSLIAPSNFSHALSAMEQAAFTRATRIDLRPDRLTVTAVTGPDVRDVRITYTAAVEAGDPSPLNAASGTLALSALEPAAPARLVRGAAKRYPVKPKGINYVLTDPGPDGGHHWRAYFKNGVYVEGDAKGRVIRRFDGG